MSWDIERLSTLSGRIYSYNRRIKDQELNSIKGLKYQSKYRISPWELYTYISETPLNKEEVKLNFYEYPIVILRANHKLIILSLSIDIVEYLQKSFIKSEMDFIIENTFIQVHQFVSHLNNNKSEKYVPTTLHGNYIPRGDSLKKISFYGDDVLDSKIITDNFEYCNYYKAGFRINTDKNQFILIGNSGTIFTKINSNLETYFKQIIEFIKYLQDNSFFQN